MMEGTIDQDSLVAQLDRQGARQRGHASLGHGVGRHVGSRLERRSRRDVDDPASVIRSSHRAHGSAAAQEAAASVECVHALEIRKGRLGDRAHAEATHEVHRRPERRKLRVVGLRRRLNSDVVVEGDVRAIVGAPRHVLGQARLFAGQVTGRAALQQPLHDCDPQAPGRSRNDDVTRGELAHGTAL
jgi:hypothetical protein